MVHAWKETGEYPDTKEGRALKKKVEASGVIRESLYAAGLHEVPLAYNVVTSEARAYVLPASFEAKAQWKASFGEEWVVGTADYVGLLMDAPWVDDLKTGRRVDYIDHRYQQAFYSLAWTLYLARTGELGGLAQCRSTITHWPRYPLADKPYRFGTVLEPDFFEDFKVRLRNLKVDKQQLRVLKEKDMSLEQKLSEGPQCTYCPSKTSCTKGLQYG